MNIDERHFSIPARRTQSNVLSWKTAMPQASEVREGFEKIEATVAGFRETQPGCSYSGCLAPIEARGTIKPYSIRRQK